MDAKKRVQQGWEDGGLQGLGRGPPGAGRNVGSLHGQQRFPF